ncbi:MAG: hypothetical protein KJZ47_06195 [Gemmatimonadales bacterium]|nr:hypothetical protein [Gemmatimonadales bacterium]
MTPGQAGCAAVLALLAGCAGPEPAPRFAVRDSSGISIAESRAPRWQQGEEWTVDSMPFLDIGGGGEGPAYEFDTIEDALRLDDGSIVVVEFGQGLIRRFGADGRLVWATGREGEGPGEYNRIRNITSYPGDSILVYDFWLGRATVLDRDGKFGRVFRIEATGRSDRVYPVDDTTLVAVYLSLQALERGAGLVRMPEPLVRARPDGAVVDTIAVIPGGESFMVPEGEVRPLFGRRGSQVAVAGGRVYTGTADQLAYGIRSPDGRLLRLVRAAGPDLALSASQIEGERQTLLNPRTPTWLRDAVAALPAPATRPAYSQLLVDESGHVWLAPYRGRSESGIPMPWQVFDADGDWLGEVQIPERVRVKRIGADYVLGVRPDQDDVEHLQLLRLTRH